MSAMGSTHTCYGAGAAGAGVPLGPTGCRPLIPSPSSLSPGSCVQGESAMISEDLLLRGQY